MNWRLGINEGLPDKNLKRLIDNVNDNILARGKRMADELRKICDY